MAHVWAGLKPEVIIHQPASWAIIAKPRVTPFLVVGGGWWCYKSQVPQPQQALGGGGCWLLHCMGRTSNGFLGSRPAEEKAPPGMSGFAWTCTWMCLCGPTSWPMAKRLASATSPHAELLANTPEALPSSTGCSFRRGRLTSRCPDLLLPHPCLPRHLPVAGPGVCGAQCWV